MAAISHIDKTKIASISRRRLVTFLAAVATRTFRWLATANLSGWLRLTSLTASGGGLGPYNH